MRDSPARAVLFAAAVCVACSVLVSGAAVLLEDRRERAAHLHRQSRVLVAAGLAGEDELLSTLELERRLEAHVRPRLVELESGVLLDVDPAGYDQRRATQDARTSRPAPRNGAGLTRIPRRALVYEIVEGDEVTTLVLPVEGKGLWSTLYGLLALSAEDLTTVRGLVFYEHAETAGLGGEIENPRWAASFVGRRVFDDGGRPVLAVARGPVGPPARDPHEVDGITGATITGRGVTELLRFWMGEHGYGPYLEAERRARGER